MKRKDYQKPTMRGVLLKQQSHILAGSGEPTSVVTSKRNGYGAAITDTWGEEE